MTDQAIAFYDRDSGTWRQAQRDLDGTHPEFTGSWPKAGMVRGGKLYSRPTLLCRTVLNREVMLPTPTRSMGVNARGWGLSKTGRRRYSAQVEANAWKFGSRPPIALLEWMMGFPDGFTDVSKKQEPHEMNIHPLAKLFPEMSPESYAALKADIQSAGRINEPIVLYQGMILDGRHRHKACQELGIHCSESELPDGSCDEDEAVDPLEFVISANLHRRQLSTKQRAIVGARMAKLGNGEHGKGPQNCGAFTCEDAAGLLGVSMRSIENARKVLAEGHPKLIELVEQDRVSVSLASKFIREVPEPKDQAKIVKLGLDAIKQTVPTKAKDKPPEGDDILPTFQRSKQRLAILRSLWDDLEAHELAVVQGWIRGEDE